MRVIANSKPIFTLLKTKFTFDPEPSGLGQDAMGFTGDQEDVNSMSLTAVHNLLEKHHLEMTDIGWMGVGTETILGTAA